MATEYSRYCRIVTIALTALTFGLSSTTIAAPVVISGSGDITGAVNQCRTALGDPNNGNTAGPLASGRREINWDGGGANDTTTAPVTPFDVFLNTRGGRFTTPGTGLSQAPPSGGLQGGLAGLFNNLTYGTTFSTFSPLRLFTPVGSNITDALFFLPGSNGTVPATVTGFGAVFSDIDVPNSASIQFFAGGASLGTFFAPVRTDSAGLSFLCVTFNAFERASRVQITSGQGALGAGVNDISDGGTTDLVVMDDFLYSEPKNLPAGAAVIPTLSEWGVILLSLLLVGGLATALRRRGRRLAS
jgi:hypothetical protein